MIRAFVPFPDKRLKTVCVPIVSVDEATREIWADMVETMEAMPGVGLAAPQIGVMQRLAVLDASEARGQAVLMGNPVVLHASVKLREHDEASPNLPGFSATIRRPRAVTVQFLNVSGEVEEREFVGLWATSVQHQIDHLNGRMFFDKLSKVKRDMLLRKFRKGAK